jgi:hypothetical protein
MSNVIDNPKPNQSAKQAKLPLYRGKQPPARKITLATRDPRRKRG